MKAKELRDRTKSELTEMERDLTRDLWKTRFANFTNQLDDTAKIRRLRREIARVKTVLTQKKP
jgi:large subunit ribosomal protein L29